MMMIEIIFLIIQIEKVVKNKSPPISKKKAEREAQLLAASNN